MPRLLRLSVIACVALFAVVVSGCVSIKQQVGQQTRLPGFVTLRLDVCVSDRDQDTYDTCNPDVRGGSVGTAEPDNGVDGDEDGSGRGQLLVGYRVPDGTIAPNNFSSVEGRVALAKSPSYTAALTGNFPPPPGFHWEGYLSGGEIPFNPKLPGDRVTQLLPEFALPPGTAGGPFTSPFRWRAIVGFRATGEGNANPSAPVSCNFTDTICFDSPSSGVANHLSTVVSDVGVLTGSSVTVAQGATATVSFPIQNQDANNRGARTVTLATSTTVPNAAATPATASLTVPRNAAPTTTVSVPVPPTTPPGTYTVALTASANSAGGGTPLVRSNTATITVLDKTAPSIRISTPAEGATFTAGQPVIADFGCTDETTGSGIASCQGPVPSGAAIDTAAVGPKTFTVDATDNDGNTTTVSRTYTVVAPAPRPLPSPPPPAGRINVTIAFDFPAAGKSTTFTLLQVKGAPKGATIAVTCKGKGCPKQKGKATRLTKRNAPRAFTLKPWLKKPLRAGTVLTVTVTKPGSFGMVKKFTVRANNRPKITETCLKPDSKTARAACTN